MKNPYFLSVWFFVLWMSNGVLKISASKNHTCYVCTGEEETANTDCLLYNLDLLRTTIQPCANDDNVCQSVFGKTAAGRKWFC